MKCMCGKYEPRETTNLVNIVIVCRNCGRSEPAKPTYTEAMEMHNILPLVGMECMINDSCYDYEYYKSVISFVGRNYIIWTHGGTEYSQTKTYLTFKPITSPIELINGKAYQFTYVNNNLTYCGIYDDNSDRFLFPDGHVMASYCKSIQLLEVTK